MEEENKKISSAVIRRLPRYYRYLGELRENGVERISSKELSHKMKVTASQIRQDLNNFGGFGQQGYGYNVSNLYNEIGKILGIDSKHSMIIVGAGNLGQALANYSDFEKRGFDTKALFDINPELVGETSSGVPIYRNEDMIPYIKEHNIEIAVLTVPKEKAIEVAESLVGTGIKAIWNFAHIDLSLSGNIVVENVHLSESLMRLSYNMVNNKKKRRG